MYLLTGLDTHPICPIYDTKAEAVNLSEVPISGAEVKAAFFWIEVV
jgi:hypothetical protein